MNEIRKSKETKTLKEQDQNSKKMQEDLFAKLSNLAEKPKEEPEEFKFRDDSDDEEKVPVEINSESKIQPPVNTQISDGDDDDEIQFESGVNFENLK